MDIDFALVLVIASAVTGVVWLFDVLLLKPKRQQAVQRYLQNEGAQQGDDNTQRLMAEPVLVEYAHSFFPVLFVVLLLRSFLVEPFTIPSGSMLPTLQVGDYILVNKYAYGLRLPVLGYEVVPVGKPKRGDIMVFRFPKDPRQSYIKRVIGVPGDHVRVEGERLYINGELMPVKLLSQSPAVDPWEYYYEENLSGVRHAIRREAGRPTLYRTDDVIVGKDEYFMMGDNRDNSNDGRFWGMVPDRYIVGKAFFIWMHKDPGLHLPHFSRDGMTR